MRLFTRLTNGFSKKVENHEAAIPAHFIHYNSYRVRPAWVVLSANWSHYIVSCQSAVTGRKHVEFHRKVRFGMPMPIRHLARI
jgi:hypothetical protein